MGRVKGGEGGGEGRGEERVRGGGEGRGRRDIHSSAESRVMLRERKYLRESLERGWCSSGGGGRGPGRAEGHLVHLAEEHHRTRSGGRERRGFPQTQLCVDCELCWEWSKPGFIRGSDQVDRVVTRSGVGVI